MSRLLGRAVVRAAAVGLVVFWAASGAAQGLAVTARALRVDERRATNLLPGGGGYERVPRGTHEGSQPALIVLVGLAGGPAATASGYRQVTFAAADDRGHPLAYQDPGGDFRPVRRWSPEWWPNAAPEEGVQLSLEMTPPPDRNATKLAFLRGSVRLLTGTKRQISLGKVARLARGPVSDKSLSDAGLAARIAAIDRRPDGSLSVTLTGRVGIVKDVDVVDKGGVVLELTRSAGGGSKELDYTFDWNGRPPRGASLRISFLVETKEVEVPFALENLPLP